MDKLWKNKQGFTLIELIVVIAILVLIAAIAIPKFANMRIVSAVKADASTAAQITKACRIQETQTGTAVTDLDNLKEIYMVVPTSQTAGTDGTTFALDPSADSSIPEGEACGGTNPYVITFTPSTDYHPYATEQHVTEHKTYTIEEE